MPEGASAGRRRGRALLALMLAAPAAAAAQPAPADPAPEAVVAELPFLEVPDASAVVVDLAPEGAARPFPLQLDTGASDSVVTPGLARELGIPVRRLKSSPYRRKTRLDRDLLFRVNARRGDHATPGPFEYGLLGGPFLKDYVLEIDYPGRRVRFLDPDRYSVPETRTAEGEAVLPLRVVANRPIVEADVGEQRVKLLVDTGAPFGVILGGRAARRARLETRAVHGMQLYGLLGEIEIALAEAPRVALGAFVVGPMPIWVAPRGLYQQAGSSDSVMGYDLLSQFTVRIDYPKRRLWLRASASPRPRIAGADWTAVRRSGALLARADGWLGVNLVLGGSPAEQLGLAPGDVIETAEGVAEEAPLAAYHDAIAAGGPLRVLRGDANGGWRPLELGGPARPAP